MAHDVQDYMQLFSSHCKESIENNRFERIEEWEGWGGMTQFLGQLDASDRPERA